MKGFLVIFLALTSQFLTGQNAFLFGEIMDSDSTRIEVWTDGEKLIDINVTDVHYSLQLGNREHYTIKFSSEGRAKYMHLINIGYKPEKIETDVDFKRYEHAIVWKHRYSHTGTILDIYKTRKIADRIKF